MIRKFFKGLIRRRLTSRMMAMNVEVAASARNVVDYRQLVLPRIEKLRATCEKLGFPLLVSVALPATTEHECYPLATSVFPDANQYVPGHMGVAAGVLGCTRLKDQPTR